jgi:MoaA/NifB/PqqE/SkfB family radical SAM enzyme
MRKIAFGYSTRCNIHCRHCVAGNDSSVPIKMELAQAVRIVDELAEAGVGGISFTAGEPFIYFADLLELVGACRKNRIYSRVVTNSYWAVSRKKANQCAELLARQGLCQMRLSYSRWHQEYVARDNIVHAARACADAGVDYFVSFITDFSEEDDENEEFLQENGLKYFPEPMIYSGRADSFDRQELRTDYQENRCMMNPYMAPDLSMYGCCDAGTQFSSTNFFYLGNLKENSVEQLLSMHEASPLYNCIRSMGISAIASFAGIKAREIVRFHKCDLCKKLFDNKEMLAKLEKSATTELPQWIR